MRTYSDCDDAKEFRVRWVGVVDDSSAGEVERLRGHLVVFRDFVKASLPHDGILSIAFLRQLGVAARNVLFCRLFDTYRRVAPPAIYSYFTKAARIEDFALTVLKRAHQSHIRPQLSNIDVVAVPSDTLFTVLRGWENLTRIHGLTGEMELGRLTAKIGNGWDTEVEIPLHAELNLLRHLIKNNLLPQNHQIQIGVSKLSCFCCDVAIKALSPHCTVQVTGCHGKVYGMWRDPGWAGCGEELRQKLDEHWNVIRQKYVEGRGVRDCRASQNSHFSHLSVGGTTEGSDKIEMDALAVRGDLRFDPDTPIVHAPIFSTSASSSSAVGTQASGSGTHAGRSG
ncbi:hypothetical protein HK097_007671 [Rhizophlyctis rosea]|uniref:Uncharacterized protein n=1 Tax=Rhizophlyctis rosea TaxID=64517 RepID=A0AAD5SEE9_9FUNG|nr:hypothetical protein HK097_007671 [Rhizophlyctis rosea]